MNRHCLFFAIAVSSAAALAHTNAWRLVGSVKEPCVVSVALHPFLYHHVTAGMEDALERELRIQDRQGRDVAYAIRPKVVRTSRIEKEWHRLSLKSLTETNGHLVIEAEYPSGAGCPDRFIALKVDTPLHDFEEHVVVASDGNRLAEGAFYDYKKYADLRKVEMPFETTFLRRISVTFSKPISPAASAMFERIVTENVKDGNEARTVRRSVVDRPFRIEGLYVAVPKMSISVEPAPADEIGFGVNACGQKTDVSAKKTVFEINSAFMPVSGVRLNVADGNFSRHVRVMRRVRTGWVPIAQGNVRSVHLLGTQSKSLELTLRGECREERLRVEVDDKDNPPISYSDTPVTVLVKPYELVFIATSGETYSLVLQKGAEKPQYDLPVLADATRMVEPVPWRIQFSEMWVDGVLNDHGPTAVWMTSDPVPIVSVIVFVVLGVICFRLFRRTR